MKNLYFNLKKVIYGLLFLFCCCLQLNASAYQLMSTNFYIVAPNGTPTLVDGNISLYDTPYSNGVDWMDGTKMKNSGENWGLIRCNTSLVVERRQPVTGPDTAFFNMWGMQQRNYRFEVTMQYFNPLIVAAYVWDNYLNNMTRVDFSGLTTVNFTVDVNPGSSAAGRFRLIYTTPANYAAIYANLYGPLTVTMTDIQALRKSDESIHVSWLADKETSTENYSVEHSSDGQHFLPMQTVIAQHTTGSHSYDYIDNNPATGDQYYRIKANGTYNRSVYSTTVQVAPDTRATSVSVYPNPVANKMVQLLWHNSTAINWHSSLVYPDGRRIVLQTINVAAGHTATALALPNHLPAGIYQLQFTDAGNHTLVKTIIVL